MNLTPARLRAILIPAVLVVGLFGASSASAADDPAVAVPAATVAGTGVLAANGDGHARLAGSYLLTGSLDGGSLSIRGIDRWSTIRVTGWNSKTRMADGTVIYRFGDGAGKFWIAGRTLVTNIESHGMRFVAAGHGRATLVGNGSYWVNGRGPLPWSDPAAANAPF
jgi:hypothetical protein